MQKISLLTVGRIRTPWITEGCAEYIKRLRLAASVTVFELSPSKYSEPDRQRDDESGRLLESARKFGGERIVLDETGDRMTSHQFATMLGRARDEGAHLCFLLGGAYGLNDAVRESGHLLRLSDMTFPHELCRLIFLEQVYRATEIRKGSGYHH